MIRRFRMSLEEGLNSKVIKVDFSKKLIELLEKTKEDLLGG